MSELAGGQPEVETSSTGFTIPVLVLSLVLGLLESSRAKGTERLLRV